MRKKHYPQLNETVYQETLENGLKVYLIPKPNFHKTYALFTTNYGSVDNCFIPFNNNDAIKVPDGIAHFLEHKLFEKEHVDAFQLFSKYGATSNAYTSFTKTSYLFSTINNVYQCVELLLDFVQTPYFSEKSVQKEKGIIAQEIQMYQDDADWRLFFGLLNNLYPNQPISIDIAGTIESIAKITVDDLYTCYNNFYQPSNMNLVITGPFDPMEMMQFILINQGNKALTYSPSPQRVVTPHTSEVIKYAEIALPITQPKMIIGYKGLDNIEELTGEERLRYKTAMNLALELLFSESSYNFQKLYNQGIIDDSFNYDFSLEQNFHIFEISCDTDNPKALSKQLNEIIANYSTSKDWNQTHFELLKKKTLGKTIASFNSLESIASQFSQNTYDDKNLFDLIEILEGTNLTLVSDVFSLFLEKAVNSLFVINPQLDD